MRRAPATRGGLENDGSSSPCRRTSAASTLATALKKMDDACTRPIVTKGCDNEAGSDKAGAMSDQFGTRPGGGQGEATGGGRGDDQPLPPVQDDDRELDQSGLDDSFIDVDGLDDDTGEQDADITGAPPLPSVPTWVGAASAAGLGLVAVQALVILGTISQGLAVERFEGDLFHKIGVAVLSNVGSANGLMLVVAAVLAALPSLLGAPQQEIHLRRQALTFGLGAALAVLLVIGTPIAVRARIFVLDAGGQSVDALARRVLATYVAGTLGTALVGLGACLGLSRYSRTVTPRP